MSGLETNDGGKATVKLNVGGSVYEISKSLLDQYPDTMLARMVSDTWSSGRNSGQNTCLFIERDGERSRYCLDYMRDGGIVDLPPTVSKNALLNIWHSTASIM